MRYSTSYADPEDADTFAFTNANFNLFIISIAVLENVPPDTGLQKIANFSILIVGLAGTRDWRGRQRHKLLGHPTR
jgi:hypothetical protein